MSATLPTAKIDWDKSLNCLDLKKHQRLGTDTIEFKHQYSEDVTSLQISYSKMQRIVDLIVNSASDFEGWRTLKDGVMMPEVFEELSSSNSETKVRGSFSAGISEKKRRLRERNRINQARRRELKKKEQQKKADISDEFSSNQRKVRS